VNDVEQAEALLRDGRAARALAAIGTEKGLRADLVRIRALRLGDPAGALPHVIARAEALARTPDDAARLLWARADRAFRPNEEDVEAELRQAWDLATDPVLRARIAIDLGRCRTIHGDLDDAMMWLAHADEQPLEGADSGHRHHLRGIVHLHRGDSLSAVQSFTIALQQAGDDASLTAWALRGRGRAYLGIDRVEAGLADYERCAALCEGRTGLTGVRTHSLNALADIAREQGRLDDAVRLFQETLAVGASHVRNVVHLNLALLEAQRGQLPAAWAHLQRVPYATSTARPFLELAGAATELLLLAHDGAADDLAGAVTRLNLAVDRSGSIDLQTLHVLLDVLALLRARPVPPRIVARTARLALHHALATDHEAEDEVRAQLLATGIELVGDYELLGRLGDGATGSVRRARDVHTGRDAAVKAVVEAAIAQRVARVELDAVSRLDHPGIVQLLDHGVVDGLDALTTGWAPGTPWLAMEVLSGGSLQLRTLGWSELVPVLDGLLAALSHAHARGVLHLDLKPANIVVDPDGLPVLIDFGIAGLSGRRRAMRAGTPTYAAPEQLGGTAEPLGPQTDLYSLGCTAWELLTGTPPFHAPTQEAMIRAHRQRPLPPLSAPDDVAAWLRRLLAKRPADRFASAAAARQALRLLAPGPLPERPPRALPPPSLAVVLRRDPRHVPRGIEAPLEAQLRTLADQGAPPTRIGGAAGQGVSHIGRHLALRALEEGLARVLWAPAGDLAHAARHQLHVVGLGGDELVPALRRRPEVADADGVAAWLRGDAEASDGLQALCGDAPWVLVRDAPATPWGPVAPAPRAWVIDLVHGGDAADHQVPQADEGMREALLDGWVALAPSLREQLVRSTNGPRSLVTYLRLLAASGRLGSGPDHLRARPGPMVPANELVDAVVRIRLDADERDALRAISDLAPWLPDDPGRPTDSLRPLATLGLARRTVGGWRLLCPVAPLRAALGA